MTIRSSARFTRPLLLCCGLLPFGIAHAQDGAVPSVTLARVPGGGLQPQIVVQGKAAHLLYFKGKPAGGDLFYSRSDDGGQTFSAPLRVNSQPGSATAMGTIRGGQLAVGRGGRAYVVWNGSPTALPRNAVAPGGDGAAPLLFTRLNDAGDAFEAQRNLMTRSFNLDGGTSIAADAEGRVYAAWHANDREGQEEGGRRVFVTSSNDDGQKFSPERPAWNEATGACGCCSLRLLAESGGKVSLLYRSATDTIHRDTYLLQSENGGQSFRGRKLHEWNIGACPMSSYALTGSGAVRVGAWETDEQIYYSVLDASGQAGQITAAPGNGPNRKYPSLAQDASGNRILAWTEGTGWNRGGRVAWQLFDAKLRPVGPAVAPQGGVPAWSFAAPIPRPDGGFTLLY